MTKDMLQVAEGIMDSAIEEFRAVNLKNIKTVQDYAENGLEIYLSDIEARYTLALCREIQEKINMGEIPSSNEWFHWRKKIECASTLVLAQMTEEQRSAFISGWEQAIGYVEDLESLAPWSRPWLYEKEIVVAGEYPEEWGASWWDQNRNELERYLLERKECE